MKSNTEEMNGSALCRTARQEGLQTILVILTSYADEELVQGFDLVKSIRSIMDGGSILDPKATKVAMRWIQDRNWAKTISL